MCPLINDAEKHCLFHYSGLIQSQPFAVHLLIIAITIIHENKLRRFLGNLLHKCRL